MTSDKPKRGPKRSKLQREAELVEFERLHNRGWSVRDIAAKFQLHPSTVHHFLKQLEERYRRQGIHERTIGVNRTLAALRDIRREVWAVWERSKEDVRREVREVVRRSPTKQKTGDETPAEKIVERMKSQEFREGRLPGNEYMATILATFRLEAELCGLFAPRKIAPVLPIDDGPDDLTPEERCEAVKRIITEMGLTVIDPSAEQQSDTTVGPAPAEDLAAVAPEPPPCDPALEPLFPETQG